MPFLPNSSQILEGKNAAPLYTFSMRFRLDPILAGPLCLGNKTGSHINVSHGGRSEDVLILLKENAITSTYELEVEELKSNKDNMFSKTKVK